MVDKRLDPMNSLHKVVARNLDKNNSPADKMGMAECCSFDFQDKKHILRWVDKKSLESADKADRMHILDSLDESHRHSEQDKSNILGSEDRKGNSGLIAAESAGGSYSWQMLLHNKKLCVT